MAGAVLARDELIIRAYSAAELSRLWQSEHPSVVSMTAVARAVSIR